MIPWEARREDPSLPLPASSGPLCSWPLTSQELFFFNSDGTYSLKEIYDDVGEKGIVIVIVSGGLKGIGPSIQIKAFFRKEYGHLIKSEHVRAENMGRCQQGLNGLVIISEFPCSYL